MAHSMQRLRITCSGRRLMQGGCVEPPAQPVQRVPTGRLVATLVSLRNPHCHFFMASLLLYSHTSTPPSVKQRHGVLRVSSLTANTVGHLRGQQSQLKLMKGKTSCLTGRKNPPRRGRKVTKESIKQRHSLGTLEGWHFVLSKVKTYSMARARIFI